MQQAGKNRGAVCTRGFVPLLLFFLCQPLYQLARADSSLYAEPLTARNIATHRVGGSDAIGGLGDWALGNGTLCAVISDPEHESGLSERGGIPIDLGRCDRDQDQLNLLQPLLNLSRSNVLPVTGIEAEVSAGEARIITRGQLSGIAFTTTYSLSLARPRALLIRTVLERVARGEDVFLFGDVSLHGRRQLTPFSVSTTDLERSVGFAHPPVDVDDTLTMVRAIVPADLHVLVGGEALEPGVAYGLQFLSAEIRDARGRRRPLPRLAINGEHFTLMGIFTRPFWIGGGDSPGLLELAQTLFMDIKRGQTVTYERVLWVGDRSDVASITDQVWSHAPRVAGRVDDPAARIHIDTRSGAPVTEIRPEADGRFGFRVPVGDYTLRVRAPGGRGIEREFAVTGESNELGLLRVGAPAAVALPDLGPLRLVFRAESGAPEVRLGDSLLGFRVGEEAIAGSALSDSISLAGVPGDPAQVVLAPGRYTVFATRGPEYSVSETQIEVAAGETTQLAIESPVRVLEHPGWLSADLHVHSEISDDSALGLRSRLAAFAAAGADVVVSTEHDRIADYAPLIRRLGLADRISSVVGVEVTSTMYSPAAPHTFGHANAYPLPLDASAYRGGAPRSEGRRLRALVADVRRLGGERVVQLNHPRGSRADEIDSLNFFTHLSVAGRPFEPRRRLDQPPNRVLVERASESGLRDLDFDVLELMNGHSMEQYRLTRADWFSLLLQGEYRPATANSDSHSLREVVALPRTYVRLSGVNRSTLDPAHFVGAVRRGFAYGSTGPLLDVELRDLAPTSTESATAAAGRSGEPRRAQIGELFSGRRGLLCVGIRAAPWVPVSQARVYTNGTLTHRLPAGPGDTLEISMTFEADSFVTVEIEGEPSRVYAALAPGFTPFAFSNPIFVDADGDGQFIAGGLPSPLPETIVRPLAR